MIRSLQYLSQSTRSSQRFCSLCKNVRNYKTTPQFLSSLSSDDKISQDNKVLEEKNLARGLIDNFKPFQDQKFIIQDVNEEMWNPQNQRTHELEQEEHIYNVERGKTGVFDIDELVTLLKEENASDICVIEVPKEAKYLDHMVIVSTRSKRHMQALATFIRKRFKSKDILETDRIPRVEGTKDSDDWVALDLGNIALHIFKPDKREEMDLESLWTVGYQFDDYSNEKESEIIEMLNSFELDKMNVIPLRQNSKKRKNPILKEEGEKIIQSRAPLKSNQIRKELI